MPSTIMQEIKNILLAVSEKISKKQFLTPHLLITAARKFRPFFTVLIHNFIQNGKKLMRGLWDT